MESVKEPRSGGWLGALVVAMALGVAGLLLAAQPAVAKKDPLAGGETTLKPNKAIAKALAKGDVDVRAIRPASANADGIAFPVSGGKLFSGKPKGKIEHAGALRLGSGKGALQLEDPQISLGKNPKLKVDVGGSSLKLFSLKLDRATVGRDGFATVFRNVRAKLSRPAAKALRGAFGLKVRKGTVFGRAMVVAEPETITVRAAKDTTLALDAGAASAITGEGISIAPIGPATVEPDGVAFPITGGVLGATDLAGEITHSGGIRLSKGGTDVDLTDFTIQIDADPDLVASVGGARVSILSLDLSGATIDIDGRDVDVSGVEARLTEAAAGALNAAFSTTLFSEGLLLGTATVAVHAR